MNEFDSFPPPNSSQIFLERLKPFEKTFETRVNAALFFAEKGIPVSPLNTVKNGVCTCRKAIECKSPGKHPMHKNWQGEATTDTNRIKRM